MSDITTNVDTILSFYYSRFLWYDIIKGNNSEEHEYEK